MANSSKPAPPDLPIFYTPAQIAEHFSVSERTVRADARAHGCCRIVGNRIFLTEQDLSSLLEVWRVKATVTSPPHAETIRPSGSFAQTPPNGRGNS